MGIFSSIKNAFSGEGLAEYWSVPEEASQIAKVIEDSADRPQLIYKHSYRCSTCMFAKNRIEEIAERIKEQADLHFVDVVNSRPISNRIAEKLDVRHESPQLLLVHQGEAVWHESHGQITSEAIFAELEKV